MVGIQVSAHPGHAFPTPHPHCPDGLPADTDIRCFLLTLPAEENLRRIERRQRARALDEREFELRTFAEEREALTKHSGMDLGEPFDVSAPPAELVATMLSRLNSKRPPGDSA
jgi:hypothetical protein